MSGSLLTELWGEGREAGAEKPKPCDGMGDAAGEERGWLCDQEGGQQHAESAESLLEQCAGKGRGDTAPRYLLCPNGKWKPIGKSCYGCYTL